MGISQLLLCCALPPHASCNRVPFTASSLQQGQHLTIACGHHPPHLCEHVALQHCDNAPVWASRRAQRISAGRHRQAAQLCAAERSDGQPRQPAAHLLGCAHHTRPCHCTLCANSPCMHAPACFPLQLHQSAFTPCRRHAAAQLFYHTHSATRPIAPLWPQATRTPTRRATGYSTPRAPRRSSRTSASTRSTKRPGARERRRAQGATAACRAWPTPRARRRGRRPAAASAATPRCVA